MKRELLGKPVTEKMDQHTKEEQEKLIAQKKDKTLAILRVGEKPDDIYYESSAIKKAEKLGIDSKRVTLSASSSQEEIEKAILELNSDEKIGGVLVLRPLPKTVDEDKIINLLDPNKDIDGITDISMARTYADKKGFSPCTAKAVMEMLKFYEVPVEGKNVVVLGRSLVIGKPVSMMVAKENGTVTICHSRTKNLPEVVKKADIVISSMGRARMLGAEYFAPDQVIIDVGINNDEEGNMCGDVDFENVKDIVAEISPVPRGVGNVTTSILMSHLIQAAKGFK